MIRQETKYIFELIENTELVCSIEITDKEDKVDWEAHVSEKLLDHCDCDIDEMAKMWQDAAELTKRLECGTTKYKKIA